MNHPFALVRIVIAISLVAVAGPAAAEEPDAVALSQRAKSIFGVLPEVARSEDNPLTEAKIDLGRMLYYDTRMSKAHDIACNTCHQLADYGVDNEPTSPGHGGVRGDRNSPTVYNAALHVAQFWDGREPNVEEQAKGPVLNPVEMGMPSEAYVLEVLHSIPGYRDAFAKAFPEAEDPITFDNFGLAVGAFERKLMTPSRFDAFLGGDLDALSSEELAGLQTFMDAGCITCHVGSTVGGTMFQKLGLVKPYETEDTGRFKVTGKESDEYVFKVPSLRNITRTEPYFHDGSIATLEEAVRTMAEYQLGKSLSDAEVDSILTFLGALEGRIPEAYVAKPELPESGPETPAPDPS